MQDWSREHQGRPAVAEAQDTTEVGLGSGFVSQMVGLNRICGIITCGLNVLGLP